MTKCHSKTLADAAFPPPPPFFTCTKKREKQGENTRLIFPSEHKTKILCVKTKPSILFCLFVGEGINYGE